jgi:hypothetical protein
MPIQEAEKTFRNNYYPCNSVSNNAQHIWLGADRVSCIEGPPYIVLSAARLHASAGVISRTFLKRFEMKQQLGWLAVVRGMAALRAAGASSASLSLVAQGALDLLKPANR